MRLVLLATVLLCSCATPPPLRQVEPVRTCDQVTLLGAPEAFAELERIDSEIESILPEFERLMDAPSSSQEEKDRIGKELGIAIGEYRVLCACHRQLKITEDCVAMEQGFKDWIE